MPRGPSVDDAHVHAEIYEAHERGFSKKIDSHIDALSIYVVFYNFVRIHKSLKMTPAMAAGIADRLWSMEDIVAVIDVHEDMPKKRGPYKKK